MTYDHIALIFNPQSTGDAPAVAEALAADIRTAGGDPTMTPTDHAGHAEELAYELSSTHKQPLIISVSGDGGYHEVVNGAMRALEEEPSRCPVVAVAAAGNANDHRRVVRARPLAEAIAKSTPRKIDLLKFTIEVGDKVISRYAHSYIGFGVTPEIAVELNRHSLTWYREVIIVLRSFMRYKSFRVTHDGLSRDIDSLIFANINEMAKIIKFKKQLDLHDNQFEVIEFAHEGRLKLLYRLVRAALRGIEDAPSYNVYEFSTEAPQSVQSDGEIQPMQGPARVRIKSVARAIDSIY